MSIEKKIRLDFTASELDAAMYEGQVLESHYVVNPNYSDEMVVWNKGRRDPSERPEYFLLDADGKPLREEEALVDIENSDASWDEFPHYIHNFGHFKVIDQGDLGDGHEAWSLVQHVESGRYFRKSGWYSSWDSGEWDGVLAEVVPAEVKVVRYQDIDKGTIFDNPAVTV